MTKRWVFWLLVAVFLVLATIGVARWRTSSPDAARSQQHAATLTRISFGMLPYADHTYAIIGATNGWFADVGIDLQYRLIKVEEIVPLLKNGSVEVVSCPPGILFSAYDSAPNLVSFVFGDLFQGYGILAQPNRGIRSYQELRAAGSSPDAALKAVVSQMRGRTFAYPTEAAIKPFIDLVLRKGGLRWSDVKSMVLDDPLTVNAMRNGQADFQVGGVPSRIVLEREGFKVILSSIDLARMARPSADSSELASILQNGWATTRQFYARHRDDALRLASVNYRIMQAINDNPDAALAVHMPYLSSVSGQTFTAADGRVIYGSLDPFVTFDGQWEWFKNPETPLYYAYVNGAILNAFIAQGIYKGKPPNVEDVILADDTYRELAALRASAEAAMQEIEAQGERGRVLAKYREARRQFGNFNYLDASRLAQEALSSL